MVTFAVSPVTPAVDPLPTVEPRAAIESLCGAPVEAWWRPDGALAGVWTHRPTRDEEWEPVAFHPFVAAVHAAYNQHRPLVLSPDAVWQCIAQGFATHVQVHAEALRTRIVAHQGRELISVRRDDFVKGDERNPWPEMFDALVAAVEERVDEVAALVVADFSTTDATSRATSSLALLAAVQPYFAYELMTMCGIPEVTLTGTVVDWRALARRAAALAAYDATWWINALRPLLDEFVRAAEGRPDVELWRSFYKWNDESGGPYLTGWINVLLPYLVGEDGLTPNPYVRGWRDGLRASFGGGPTLGQLPSGLVRVPFLWKYLLHEYRMELVGGFAAVGQDLRTRAVRPELGWAVRAL